MHVSARFGAHAVLCCTHPFCYTCVAICERRYALPDSSPCVGVDGYSWVSRQGAGRPADFPRPTLEEPVFQRKSEERSATQAAMLKSIQKGRLRGAQFICAVCSPWRHTPDTSSARTSRASFASAYLSNAPPSARSTAQCKKCQPMQGACAALVLSVPLHVPWEFNDG